MRSQLTRHVLRRRLAHRGMLPLRAIPMSCISQRSFPFEYTQASRLCQRRTFFGFFKKPPRILKDPEIEPGYGVLLQFSSYKAQNLRPPPRQELVEAFKEFFKFKKATHRPVNTSQAALAHALLDYLSQSPQSPGGVELTVADLRTAQYALLVKPRGDPKNLITLSKALFVQIRKLSLEALSPDQRKPYVGHQAKKPRAKRVDDGEHAHDLAFLLRVFAQYGNAMEAREYLMKYWAKFGQNNPDISMGRTKGLWIPVAKGLALEDNLQDLLNFLAVMEEKIGIGYIQSVHEIMTTLFARRDDFEKMKEWFGKPIKSDSVSLPSNQAYTEAFLCAIRNDQKDWAISVYQDIANELETAPKTLYVEESIRLVYRFAVLLLDKGAEHIQQMMSKAGSIDSKLRPNIDILNVLMEAAIQKDDIYLAERFASMAEGLDLKPDRRYYSLQVEYRLRANDLDGAFKAYRSLQNFERDKEDWPKLNKLVRAMCAAPNPAHDRVLDITSYLEQANASLDPETVVSICLAFLRNDEQCEVIDTLSLHSIHYSYEERQLISKAFVEYCVDKSNSTARAWDAYTLLRQFFPDVTVADRVTVMEAFFQRNRPDMACHVFGHMRQSENALNRPTTLEYVRFFEGIGRCPDLESLRIVHNMMKMDTTITPNTQLYNSLMLAYTACDEHHRALDFWKEISNSVEGPSYNTLEIVFRTHETSGFGERAARQLWDKLHRLEIDIPPKVYTAYAAFLASHHFIGELKDLLEKMEAEVGESPGYMTLGVVYNALIMDKDKDDFEAWAKDLFPHAWDQLAQSKKRRDGDGIMKFQFIRPWVA